MGNSAVAGMGMASVVHHTAMSTATAATCCAAGCIPAGVPVDVFQDLAEAEAIGSKIASHLGFEEPANPAQSVAELRKLGWRELVQGAEDAEADGYNNVNIDGWLLPEALAVLFERGVDPDIELIIGANRTVERAHALAEQFDAHAIALTELASHLPEADIPPVARAYRG